MTTQRATPNQPALDAGLCAANLLVCGMPGQGKAHALRTVLLPAPADLGTPVPSRVAAGSGAGITVCPVRAEYICPMTGTTTCTTSKSEQKRCPAC